MKSKKEKFSNEQKDMIYVQVMDVMINNSDIKNSVITDASEYCVEDLNNELTPENCFEILSNVVDIGYFKLYYDNRQNYIVKSFDYEAEKGMTEDEIELQLEMFFDMLVEDFRDLDVYSNGEYVGFKINDFEFFISEKKVESYVITELNKHLETAVRKFIDHLETSYDNFDDLLNDNNIVSGAMVQDLGYFIYTEMIEDIIDDVVDFGDVDHDLIKNVEDFDARTTNIEFKKDDYEEHNKYKSLKEKIQSLKYSLTENINNYKNEIFDFFKEQGVIVQEVPNYTGDPQAFYNNIRKLNGAIYTADQPFEGEKTWLIFTSEQDAKKAAIKKIIDKYLSSDSSDSNTNTSESTNIITDIFFVKNEYFSSPLEMRRKLVKQIIDDMTNSLSTDELLREVGGKDNLKFKYQKANELDLIDFYNNISDEEVKQKDPELYNNYITKINEYNDKLSKLEEWKTNQEEKEKFGSNELRAYETRKNGINNKIRMITNEYIKAVNKMAGIKPFEQLTEEELINYAKIWNARNLNDRITKKLNKENPVDFLKSIGYTNDDLLKLYNEGYFDAEFETKELTREEADEDLKAKESDKKTFEEAYDILQNSYQGDIDMVLDEVDYESKRLDVGLVAYGLN